MRRSLAMALLGGALCTLSGCGNDEASTPIAPAGNTVPVRGGTLHLASFGDIRSLDPATAADALSNMMVEPIFAGLVDFDEKGHVVDDLALRHEISDDGLAYTFTLRENVHFHDGEELTADDVKRSIDRSLHPDTPNPSASLYERIVGFDDYRKKKTESLAGVEVGGRYIVTIRLKSRDSMMLPMLALHALRPVCKSAGARYDDAWHPCGAGPFRLPPNGWEHGVRAAVVRHEQYFRPGLPYLDGIVFYYSMNFVTQRFKFEAGELDVVRDLTQGDLARYTTDARWKPFGAFEPPISAHGEAMNTELSPFDNVEVRRAVAAAIDRDEYRKLRPGTVLPSGRAVPIDIPGFSETVEGQKFDLQAALEHMRRAGYPYDPKTGEGGYPHRIEYLTYAQGYSLFASQVLQQQLAKIGIRIDIRLTSFGTYLSLSQRRKRIQMSPQGWTQDYPDALDFYEALFSSTNIADDGATNSSFYKNAELDGLVDRARQELDPSARQKLYDRAQEIVRDDAPWAFTHSYRWYRVRQPYVKDLATHPTWVFGLNNAWIDRGKAALAKRAGVFGELLGLRSTSP